MKEEDKLKEEYGTDGPWKVPDGYFEATYVEILSNLPEYPAAPKPQTLSMWQRVKPYVYLAAMFAGIWLMMKVFHNVSGMNELSLDNPPEQIAAYMGDPDVADLYLLPSTISDSELLDEVSDEYDNIDEFKKDFDYSINPQYDKISLE